MTAVAWIVGGLLAWAALALGIAVAVGKSVAVADACCPHEVDVPRLADGGIFL